MTADSIFGIPGIALATLVLLVSFTVSYLAWRRGSLTGPAALLASAFALGYYLSGGLRLVSLLLLFFLSSTVLTHYREQDKHRIEKDIHEKKGARDSFQVLANGGPALLMGTLSWLASTASAHLQAALLLAAAGALAASNADTWASELGVLSRRQPVYILSRRPVQTGLSGGVTRTGTLAALAGGCFIALAYGVLNLTDFLTGDPLHILKSLGLKILLITGAGFLGSVIDSVLGETLQALYQHHSHHHLTEQPHEDGRPNRLKRGWPWLNNDWVNLLSSLLSAALLCGTALLTLN